MPVIRGGKAGRDEPSERTLSYLGDVSGDKQADNIGPFELVAEQATAPVPVGRCYARSTPSDGWFIATRLGLEQNRLRRLLTVQTIRREELAFYGTACRKTFIP